VKAHAAIPLTKVVEILADWDKNELRISPFPMPVTPVA
jgi:hypothetical protein